MPCGLSGTRKRTQNLVRSELYDYRAALAGDGRPDGCLIVAAFREEWRKPILVYRAIEKTFMVYLVLTNGSWPYA
jgi:hypothetical protein